MAVLAIASNNGNAIKITATFDRVSFELLNEVTDPKFSAKWNAIVENAIKLIRKYSSDINIIES